MGIQHYDEGVTKERFGPLAPTGNRYFNLFVRSVLAFVVPWATIKQIVLFDFASYTGIAYGVSPPHDCYYLGITVILCCLHACRISYIFRVYKPFKLQKKTIYRCVIPTPPTHPCHIVSLVFIETFQRILPEKAAAAGMVASRRIRHREKRPHCPNES